jgi:hypothetical protein
VYWLLIEGDNGSGKDTLRAFFEREGWLHVNDSAAALAELEQARKHAGRDRLRAYLRYCQACAATAADSATKRVSVRYWPSTLAGGYADELVDAAELDRMLGECMRSFPDPDGVIELRCDLDQRVQRILRRVPEESGHADSLDPERGRRHRFALERIASHWNRPWLVLDTTSLTPGQVFEAARDWVGGQETRGK